MPPPQRVVEARRRMLSWRSAGEPSTLTRPQQHRLVAGVCVGLAEHLGVSPLLVRVAFVVAALTMSGVGIVVYIVLWAVLPQDDSDLRAASAHLRTAATTGRPAAAAQARATLARFSRYDENVRMAVLGLAAIIIGTLLIARRFTDQVNLSVALPATAVLAGLVLGLGQLDRSERERWLAPVALGGPWGVGRIVGGLLLVIIGVVLLLAPRLGASALLVVVLALLVVLAGVAVVLGPWARRLLLDLERERGERVRQEERAEIAAHLHDSVLQTLALIQRRSHDGETVARLARSQERQLRDYLYGAPPPDDETEPASIVAAVRASCAEIEDERGVPIELVSVGDAPVGAAEQALLQALREALLNAVRHGKVGVSVYVEVMAGRVEAFVRDRGPGFDPEAVPADRLGVRESVIGRMQRAGGSASVRPAPGGGTEVALSLPAS